MIKQKRHIDFICIAVGFLFLFNPTVNIIDYLPDFFGYTIIYFSLLNLSDISGPMEEARRGFGRMILVDIGKLLALLWVFGMSATSERSSSILLWTFVLSVMELVFLIPTLLKFFSGMISLGYLNENTSVIGYKTGHGDKKKRKNFTEAIRSLTLTFIIFKISMTLLPEFAYLTSTEHSANYGIYILYQNIGTLRLLCFVPIFIFGIVWAIKMFGYFARVRRDADFMNALNTKYESTVLHRKGLFVKRSVKEFGLIMSLAFLFSLDLRIDHIDVLPDAIGLIISLVAFLVIFKHVKTNKPLCYMVIGLNIISSFGVFMSEYIFFRDHSYSAVLRDEAALDSFNLVMAFTVLNALYFWALVLYTIKIMRITVREHVNPISMSEGHYEAEERMISARRKEIDRYFICLFLSAFLYAVSDVCYSALIMDYKFMTLVNTVCGIIFIIAFLKAKSEIDSSVEATYMLE